MCGNYRRSAMPAVRFDVVSVYQVPGLEREFLHFEGAFDWNEHGGSKPHGHLAFGVFEFFVPGHLDRF